MRFISAIYVLSLLFFCACDDEWLNRVPEASTLQKGFVYDILEKRGNFTIFLDAVNKTGYKDLFTGKGLSTIFAPTDNVFKRYLRKKNLSSIDEISLEELELIVSQHIIKYSYSMSAFLDFQPSIGGEILPGLCYKHRTMSREAITSRYDPISDQTYKIFNKEKYLPVFNTNMFKSLGINDPESDYKYFYPRSNWYGNDNRIYPANAAVSEAAIPTDNGYLYIIDQVIQPLRTIHSVMEDTTLNFSLMARLYDRFPNFRYNQNLTEKYAEPGDSLYVFYHMNTPNFALLDIANEWTSDREDWILLGRDACNGFVPDNKSLERFFKDFWQDPSLSQKYESYEDLDRLALFYLISNHFVRSAGPTFPQHIREGMMNAWGYPYLFDVDSDVTHREICSNGVMYGINRVEIPTIYETVTRPMFQSPKYRIFSYMLMKAGMLSILANKERQITLFLPSDEALTTAGYTLSEDPSGNMSKYNIQKNGKTVATKDLESLIKYHVISDVIDPDVIMEEEVSWHETDQQSAFLKLGERRVVSENNNAVNMGIDEFNTDGKWGKWRAYEIKKIIEGSSVNITEAMNSQNTEWKPWITKWKNELAVKTEHYTGSRDNLVPFFNSRGVMFCTHDSWVRTGENGIPKPKSNSDKTQNKELTSWLGKHMLARKSNPDLNILDFICGTVRNKTFETVTPGFNIRIINMEEVSNSDYGQYKVNIELPEDEGSRIVEAYGPLYARDCIFFILPTNASAFVSQRSE